MFQLFGSYFGHLQGLGVLGGVTVVSGVEATDEEGVNVNEEENCEIGFTVKGEITSVVCGHGDVDVESEEIEESVKSRSLEVNCSRDVDGKGFVTNVVTLVACGNGGVDVKNCDIEESVRE